MDHALAARGKAKRAAEHALVDREEALAQLDAALAERNEALAQRNEALADRDQVTAQRAEAAESLERAAAELDELARANERLRHQYESAVTTRGATLAIRNAAIESSPDGRRPHRLAVAIAVTSLLVVALAVILILSSH
jgi:uncharacterized protein (DUF3084 family)